MGRMEEFLSICKIFQENMYVIKDELDHCEEKLPEIIYISLSKRSDPDFDPVPLFRSGSDLAKKIRIRIHNTGSAMCMCDSSACLLCGYDNLRNKGSSPNHKSGKYKECLSWYSQETTLDGKFACLTSVSKVDELII